MDKESRSFPHVGVVLGRVVSVGGRHPEDRSGRWSTSDTVRTGSVPVRSTYPSVLSPLVGVFGVFDYLC